MKKLRKILGALLLTAMLVTTIAAVVVSANDNSQLSTTQGGTVIVVDGLGDCEAKLAAIDAATTPSEKAKKVLEAHSYILDNNFWITEEYKAFINKLNSKTYEVFEALAESLITYSGDDAGSYADLVIALSAINGLMEEFPKIEYNNTPGAVYTGVVSHVNSLVNKLGEDDSMEDLMTGLAEIYTYLRATPVNPTTDMYFEFLEKYISLSAALGKKFEAAVSDAPSEDDKLAVLVEIRDYVEATPITESLVTKFNSIRQSVIDSYANINDALNGLVAVPELAAPTYIDAAELSTKLDVIDAAADIEARKTAVKAAYVYIAAYDLAPDANDAALALVQRYVVARDALVKELFETIDTAAGVTAKSEALIAVSNYLSECRLSEAAVIQFNQKREEFMRNCFDFVAKAQNTVPNGALSLPTYTASASEESLNLYLAALESANGKYASATDALEKASAIDEAKNAAMALYLYLNAATLDTSAAYYSEFLTKYTTARQTFVANLFAEIDSADDKDAAFAKARDYFNAYPITKALVVAFNEKVDATYSDDEAKADSLKATSPYIEIDKLCAVVAGEGSIDEKYEAILNLYRYRIRKLDVTDAAYQPFAADGAGLYDMTVSKFLDLCDEYVDNAKDADKKVAALEKVSAMVESFYVRPLAFNAFVENVFYTAISSYQDTVNNISNVTAEKAVHAEDLLMLVAEFERAVSFSARAEAYKTLSTSYKENDSTVITSTDSAYVAVIEAYNKAKAAFSQEMIEFIQSIQDSSTMTSQLSEVYNYITNANVDLTNAVITEYNTKLETEKQTDYAAKSEYFKNGVPALGAYASENLVVDFTAVNELLASATKENFALAFAALAATADAALAFDFAKDGFFDVIQRFNAAKTGIIEAYNTQYANAADANAKKLVISDAKTYFTNNPISINMLNGYHALKDSYIKEMSDVFENERALFESVIDDMLMCLMFLDIDALSAEEKDRYNNIEEKIVTPVFVTAIEGKILAMDFKEGNLALIHQGTLIKWVKQYVRTNEIDTEYKYDTLVEELLVIYCRNLVTMATEITNVSERLTTLAELEAYFVENDFTESVMNAFAAQKKEAVDKAVVEALYSLLDYAYAMENATEKEDTIQKIETAILANGLSAYVVQAYNKYENTKANELCADAFKKILGEIDAIGDENTRKAEIDALGTYLTEKKLPKTLVAIYNERYTKKIAAVEPDAATQEGSLDGLKAALTLFNAKETLADMKSEFANVVAYMNANSIKDKEVVGSAAKAPINAIVYSSAAGLAKAFETAISAETPVAADVLEAFADIAKYVGFGACVTASDAVSLGEIFNNIAAISDDSAKMAAITEMEAYITNNKTSAAVVNAFNEKFSKTLTVPEAQTPTEKTAATLNEALEETAKVSAAQSLNEYKAAIEAVLDFLNTRTVDSSAVADIYDKIDEAYADYQARYAENKELLEANTPFDQYLLPNEKDTNGTNKAASNFIYDYESFKTPYNNTVRDANPTNTHMVEVLEDGETTNGYILSTSPKMYDTDTPRTSNRWYGITFTDNANSVVVEFDFMFPTGIRKSAMDFEAYFVHAGSNAYTYSKIMITDGVLVYDQVGCNSATNKTPIPNYQLGDEKITFTQGQWYNIVLIIDTDANTAEYIIDHVSLGEFSLDGVRDKNLTDADSPKYLRMNAAIGSQHATDNLKVYDGNAYRTLGKFDKMTDADKFKFYVDYYYNEAFPVINRYTAYLNALELYDTVKTETTLAEWVAKLEAKDYSAEGADQSHQYHLNYINDAIKQVEATGFSSDAAVLKSDKLLAGLDDYIANNGKYMKFSDPVFAVARNKIAYLKTCVVRANAVTALAYAINNFHRAYSLSAMKVHAASVYELLPSANITEDTLESDMSLDKMKSVFDTIKQDKRVLAVLGTASNVNVLTYVSEYMSEHMATMERSENDIKLLDCMGFIESIVENKELTGEAYEAELLKKAVENYDFVETYMAVIRGIINSGSDKYNAEKAENIRIKHLVEVIDETFYVTLQKTHLEVMKTQIDKYAAADSYIEKLGICLYLDQYINENDIDYTNPTAVEYRNKLELFKAEVVSYEANYKNILEANTKTFVGLVKEMSALVKYADIKPIYDKATVYYYAMNVDSEEAQAAMAEYEEIGEKLTALAENSAMFLGYADTLSSSKIRMAQKYRALVNAKKYVELGIDDSIEGVKDAIATYNKALTEYNTVIDNINGDVSNVSNVVTAVRSGSIASVVLAVVKAIFSK